MSYTYTEHTADGAQTTFPFRFAGRDKAYLKAADILVEVYRDGKWVATSGWQLTGTNQITFTVAPSAGTKLRIRRVMEKEYPYAEFDRGITLDMKSLNNSFIHLLSITQELLDGFYPEGYFVKQDVNYGGHKITNLGDGTDPKDAVNKSQLDAVDKKHTDWNTQQDVEIAGIKKGMVSSVAHRTIPWYMVAQGGEQIIRPPYTFDDAMVFINGVLQHEIAGAVSVGHDVITFPEPLVAGDEVYVLIGSRLTPPTTEDTILFHQEVSAGTQSIDFVTQFKRIDVYLDGLYQPNHTFEIFGSTITFSEPLPDCSLSAKLQLL